MARNNGGQLQSQHFPDASMFRGNIPIDVTDISTKSKLEEICTEMGETADVLGALDIRIVKPGEGNASVLPSVSQFVIDVENMNGAEFDRQTSLLLMLARHGFILAALNYTRANNEFQDAQFVLHSLPDGKWVYDILCEEGDYSFREYNTSTQAPANYDKRLNPDLGLQIVQGIGAIASFSTKPMSLEEVAQYIYDSAQLKIRERTFSAALEPGIVINASIASTIQVTRKEVLETPSSYGMTVTEVLPNRPDIQVQFELSRKPKSPARLVMAGEIRNSATSDDRASDFDSLRGMFLGNPDDALDTMLQALKNAKSSGLNK